MSVGHFEAKKHAIRQTQDGWVVSFIVHPNDMSSDFATAPLGTRYMVGFAAIGDDEQPISPAGPSTQKRKDLDATEPSPGKDTAKPAGETQQARYAAMSAGEQAVVRAAMLPKDERFQIWAEQQVYPGRMGMGLGEVVCIAFIRNQCCGGNSRKLIAEVPEYLDRFLAMELSFRIAVGEVAEPR